MPSDVRRSVLVVEDDDVIRDALRGLLAEAYDVVCVATLASARRVLAGIRFDAVLLDLVLDEEHGEALMHDFAAARIAPAAVVVVSASRMAPTIARAYGVPFLAKPFEAEAVHAALVRAIEEERVPRTRA